MTAKSKRLTLILLAVLTAASVWGQEPEVIVGKIEFPKRVWGVQTMPFDITNNTDWLKFLVVETDAAFGESYVNPHRVVRTALVLEPSARLTVASKLEIPPNYGTLTLRVRIFDVVDTLDDLSAGTVVFEQPFTMKFHTPEAVMPYFQERLTLPPMVGVHGLLDNEFARLMLLMLHENKTISEIATICQTDSSYAREMAEQMVSEKYLTKEPERYLVNVPIINQTYAQSGRQLADRISDRLAEKITANLANRRSVIDSLISAGVFNGDSTDFVGGGTLLFQPYPLIGGLYLWQVLGQKFITGSHSLLIFDRTDPCNADIGPFTYMVQGGDYFNGHHYFAAEPSRGGYDSHFGDRMPKVECLPGFEKTRKALEGIHWNYAPGETADMFLYDSTLINPMLRRIDVGIEEILLDAVTELRQINKQFYSTDLALGTSYWFWNLTASLTLDKLTKSKVVTPTGNGQFRFREKTS